MFNFPFNSLDRISNLSCYVFLIVQPLHFNMFYHRLLSGKTMTFSLLHFCLTKEFLPANNAKIQLHSNSELNWADSHVPFEKLTEDFCADRSNYHDKDLNIE